MTDLAVTASAVIKGSNALTQNGISGETIVAGKICYKDTTTGKWMLADGDSATAIARGAGTLGMALNGASDGQPIQVETEGDVTVDAVLTAGTTYYLSDAPGGIAPLADLASGDYYCIVGIAKSTTVLSLKFHYSGVAA